MFTDSFDEAYIYDFHAGEESLPDVPFAPTEACPSPRPRRALRPDRGVPFAPTEERVVTEMLKLSRLDESDLLYDLGCGDGRIIVAAARDFGARAVGVEIDPLLLEEARQHAKWNGVRHKLTLLEDDLFTVDVSRATVVTLYLLPSVNLELRPRLLRELRPGARIVSHAFDMAEWKPDEVIECRGTRLFLWIVPASVAGAWKWRTQDGRAFRVKLEQAFQELSGRAWIDGREALLQSARLRGTHLELAIRADGAAAPEIFTSRVSDDRLLPAAGSSQASAGVRA